MRYELKSIPVWPVVKIGFFVNLVVGLIVGILYAMFLVPIIALMSSVPALESGDFNFDAAPLGLLMIIMPLMSALSSAFFGTLFLVIVVFVYNMSAKFVGGLELNFDRVDAQPGAPAPATAQTAPVQSAPPPPPPASEMPPKQEPGTSEPGSESNI